ncbi:MAG: CDP-diacylglycerol--glycerol-3-phosphate 3-phosphatidyltransferase [Methylacidiphilaceae bacterium]|nr:CDP-diacylglycerol--glycerol-3-phosphate 3-phosphatidyltransferase [Candidatus Methylacidiphilaceae bacterium]
MPKAVATAKQWNLPNQISLGRLCICALFVGDVSLPWAYSATTALLLFAIGSLTDWVDGWVARRHNLVSDLGKLLDPLADKILICAAFLVLLERGVVPLWAVVVIMAREFLVTGLRALTAARGAVLAAAPSGKWKTLAQMLYVLMMLTQMALSEIGGGGKERAGRLLEAPATVLLWIAVGITFASGVLYFYRCRAIVFSGEGTEKGGEKDLERRPYSSGSGNRMARP